MCPTQPRRPRAGVVALAFPGYYLGEELAPAKYAEMLTHLRGQELDLVPLEAVVQDIEAAQRAGRTLAAAGVDFICAILTTFVPDHYIVELLQACDAPIFLWAIEREIGCIALVGGLLINPTLHDLHKHYALHGSDIGDAATTTHLMAFGRAAMLRQVLRRMRVGYMGGNPEIMFSMAVDEVGLKQVLGVSVVPLRDVDYTRRQEAVSEAAARADWEGVQRKVGSVRVAEADALEASQGYLAAQQMAEDLRLDALSLNCWSHLKSKICLPIARLNDAGISAACEGDLHSTILMRLLYELTGRAALNGDFLRLLPEDNQILFSHCGAGAFSMARSPQDIVLHESIETHDGLAVFFPADQPGTVTALNLMGSRAGYRLAVMVGQVAETDMRYEGTPMRLRFETPIQEILQRAVRAGAGHHWNLAYGDHARTFALLGQFLGIDYNLLSE